MRLSNPMPTSSPRDKSHNKQYKFNLGEIIAENCLNTVKGINLYIQEALCEHNGMHKKKYMYTHIVVKIVEHNVK